MKHKKQTLKSFITLAMCLFVTVSFASDFEFSVIGLAPVDGNAVVKTTDNKMHVVKVGDTLPGTTAKVVQILPDKLVLEDVIDDGNGKAKQRLWLHQASSSNAKSRVQRLEKQGSKRKPLVVNIAGGKPK